MSPLVAPEAVDQELLQLCLLLIVPRSSPAVSEPTSEVAALNQSFVLDKCGEEVQVFGLLPEVEPGLAPGVGDVFEVGLDDGT